MVVGKYIIHPTVIQNDPKGTRFIFPAIGGTLQGSNDHPNFHDGIDGPAGNWACFHSDESGISLDIKLILKTHDGGVTSVNAIGRSVRDKNDRMKASLRLASTNETGDIGLMRFNNKVLVGIGQKVGNVVRVDYYDVL